jgi:glycosyltransferase involved in cell wall biosynthesis
LCADVLGRFGYPVGCLDLSESFSTVNLDLALPPPPPPTPGGAVIIHLNAPMMPQTRLLLGRRRTAGQRVIGYWAWELPTIPPEWHKGFDYVHEVWTPSAFCADAIRPFTRRPVHVVPHPVGHPQRAVLDRAAFGLPANAFVVLSMLHFGSGFTRKNPLAAIRAFREAFGDHPDTAMIVKVTADTPLPWAEAALAETIGGATNIRLMRDTLPRADLTALIGTCDAVLSLHRAEGFGLTLAEAMRLERPVVATGWSGNLEFMSADSAALVPSRLVAVNDPQSTYSSDERWAEPDEGHAARWLRRLKDDSDGARSLGAAAARYVESRLGLTAYARAVTAALSVAALRDPIRSTRASE